MSSLAQQEIAASEYDSEEWTAANPDLSDQLQFVIDDVVANVESLSKHRYGCRVVQRAIEFCVEKQKAVVLDHIIQCHELLVDDQYGNYVVQQSLVCGSDKHQAAILKTLTKDYGSFVRYSKHKYASNVVEAMLKYGSVHHKGLILDELLKVSLGYFCNLHEFENVVQTTSLIISLSPTFSNYLYDQPSNPDIAGLSPCCAVELALDPIANYVVKSSLECVNNEEKVSKLMDSLNSHRLELVSDCVSKL